MRFCRPPWLSWHARVARTGGVLYAGMMLTEAGPKVIEFNCRFGVILRPRLFCPCLNRTCYEIFEACCTGDLSSTDIVWSDSAAVTVVMATEGYPVRSSAPVAIEGLEAAAAAGCKVFQAGYCRA